MRDNNADANIDIASAIIIALAISIFASALLSLMSYFDLFGLDALPIWVGAVAFPVIYGLALTSTFRAIRVRESEYIVLASVSIIRNTLNVATRILGFFVGGGLVPLLVAEIFSALASIRYLAGKRIYQRLQMSFREKSNNLVTVAKKWGRFPKYELPSVLLDQVALAVPLFIINSRFGPDSAGLFFMAQRIVTLPNIHIGSAYSDIFRSGFSELIRNRKATEAKELFNNFLCKIALVGAVVAIPMATIVPNFIGLLLGNKWLGAETLIPWLVLWAASSLIVSSLSPILPLLQKQNYKLIYDISTLILLSAALTLAREGSLLFHVQALAFANIFSNFIYLVIMMQQSRKL